MPVTVSKRGRGKCPECGQFSDSLHRHQLARHEKRAVIHFRDETESYELVRDEVDGMFHCPRCTSKFGNRESILGHARRLCKEMCKETRVKKRAASPLHDSRPSSSSMRLTIKLPPAKKAKVSHGSQSEQLATSSRPVDQPNASSNDAPDIPCIDLTKRGEADSDGDTTMVKITGEQMMHVKPEEMEVEAKKLLDVPSDAQEQEGEGESSGYSDEEDMVDEWLRNSSPQTQDDSATEDVTDMASVPTLRPFQSAIPEPTVHNGTEEASSSITTQLPTPTISHTSLSPPSTPSHPRPDPRAAFALASSSASTSFSLRPATFFASDSSDSESGDDLDSNRCDIESFLAGRKPDLSHLLPAFLGLGVETADDVDALSTMDPRDEWELIKTEWLQRRSKITTLQWMTLKRALLNRRAASLSASIPSTRPRPRDVATPADGDSPVCKFLCTLKIPLDRHAHAFSDIKSEAQLDMVSRMREDWDMWRDELLRKGLSYFEWLILREGLKVRAAVGLQHRSESS